MEKTLILIRHAHRDTSDRQADNGLSDKGRAQAADLLRYWRKTFREQKPAMLSSSKRRCIETLEPIARQAGVKLRELPDLLEQEEGELDAKFRRRVAGFIEWWKQEAPELTVICSHGDWIPLALELAIGSKVTIKKGGWAQIEQKEGEQPRLSWLLQNFKSF